MIQPNNPSREVRYALLKKALKSVNREEDFENIISLMSPPQPITTLLPPMSLKGKRVGIIGAGVSGLACAYELRKLGCEVTILEGDKNRIGGRVYTYQFGGGYYGELGAMRIPVAHETTWHYINEFHLNTNPFIQNSENNILYVKKQRFLGLDIDQPVSNYLYPLFQVPPDTPPLSKLLTTAYNQPILSIPKEIRPYILEIRKEYPNLINRIGHIDFRESCQLLGFNTNTIDLINSVIGTDSGFFYLDFLEILKERYPVSFKYLYEITGGLDKLPYAFYQSFKHNNPHLGRVTLKMGTRITDITERLNKINLRYLNRFSNTIHEDTFDKVICAIPFSSLRLVNLNPLFSIRKMEAIREVNYSPSQKTIILFKERFWERKINQKMILGGGITTDLPINTSWFPSHPFYGQGGVLDVSYNMNLDATRLGNLDETERIYFILRELEEAMGLSFGYLDDMMIDYKTINWNTNELTLGALTKYYTEQNKLFAYASYTPEYHQKIFFAGEHVSPFHGWIQGALISGMQAANLLALSEKN